MHNMHIMLLLYRYVHYTAQFIYSTNMLYSLEFACTNDKKIALCPILLLAVPQKEDQALTISIV